MRRAFSCAFKSGIASIYSEIIFTLVTSIFNSVVVEVAKFEKGERTVRKREIKRVKTKIEQFKREI